MKDQIHNLVVTNSTTCFIPQGAGVKVGVKTEYYILEINNVQPLMCLYRLF